jgi:hypothetical protein
MSPRTRPLLLAALIALSACSRTDNEPGEGGVTVGEAKALDAAAEKLEARDKAAEADPGSAPEDGE